MNDFKILPIKIFINRFNEILWKHFLKSLVKFLSLYKDVLDSYVLDFFTENLWQKLTSQWAEVLQTFTNEELANFISTEVPFKSNHVLPLSLIAYRQTCKLFTLPQDPHFQKVGGGHLQEDPTNFFLNHLETLSPTRDGNNEITKDGQHKLLHHVFRKHLKPKKQHEVFRLGTVTSKIFKWSGADLMIDLGSGQGHLGRVLSYGFNIPMVCVDANDQFILGAKKFDADLEKFRSRFKSENLVGPKHKICKINQHTNFEDLKQLTESLMKSWEHAEVNQKIMLIGLHSCGDLSSNLIKFYAKFSDCAAISLISCCYMKLSTSSENKKLDLNIIGYPMSHFLLTTNDSDLSYAAREMSCHAVKKYSDKLRTEPMHTKVHTYRAALEQIIIEKRPDLRHCGLRSINNAHNLDFHEYAKRAILKLENFTLNENEFLSKDIQKNLRDWKKATVFYSIRLMLAPAIETLILLDRLLYLHENGFKNSFLSPVFDSEVSPRNYALISMKKSSFPAAQI